MKKLPNRCRQASAAPLIRTYLIAIFILVVYICTVDATVNLAFGRCRVGTIYRPTSCTRCVCGLLNFMLCRQECVPNQEGPATQSPAGPAIGPTIVPILIPSLIIRRPFSLTNFTNIDFNYANDSFTEHPETHI